MRSRALLLALVLATSTVAAACGGGSGEKPSQAQVEEVVESLFASQSPTADQVTCLAENLRDELSAKILQKLVDEDEEGSEEEADQAAEAFKAASEACLDGA